MIHSNNYPTDSDNEKSQLQNKLDTLLSKYSDQNIFSMLAGFTRILSDNKKRDQWPGMYDNLEVMFKCGKYVPLSGPMLGISVCIRDSDFFTKVAKLCGKERSAIANLELLATSWNATFADTAIWMGKTFEDISRENVNDILEDRDKAFSKYDNDNVKFGRNYFREPHNAKGVQKIGLPALTKLWDLKERPKSPTEKGFKAVLSDKNLDNEKVIPYSKTGGNFLATDAFSVVPGLKGKKVYQLDYRWGALRARYPMTRLIDEIVQIGDGIYLGQLVFSTKNFSLGTIEIPTLNGESKIISLGIDYDPYDDRESILEKVKEFFTGDNDENVDYGYQNNGYFLMMDPAYADLIYADNAFPELKPHDGEIGYSLLNESLK